MIGLRDRDVDKPEMLPQLGHDPVPRWPAPGMMQALVPSLVLPDWVDLAVVFGMDTGRQ